MPAAFALALLAAPAAGLNRFSSWLRPQSRGRPAEIAAMQTRLKGLAAAEGTEICTATRLYFLEVVKARAVTALCKSGPERERELGRFDADVEHINEAIAARCS